MAVWRGGAQGAVILAEPALAATVERGHAESFSDQAEFLVPFTAMMIETVKLEHAGASP
jgi:hypothetical protein